METVLYSVITLPIGLTVLSYHLLKTVHFYIAHNNTSTTSSVYPECTMVLLTGLTFSLALGLVDVVVVAEEVLDRTVADRSMTPSSLWTSNSNPGTQLWPDNRKKTYEYSLKKILAPPHTISWGPIEYFGWPQFFLTKRQCFQPLQTHVAKLLQNFS